MMKQILVTLLLCISLTPAFGENSGHSTTHKVLNIINTALDATETIRNEISKDDSAQPETRPQGPEEKEKGFLGKTADIIKNLGDEERSLILDIIGIKESWDQLKQNCSEIKETTITTLNLLVWIAVGVAIVTCLVPILLLVIALYLRQINRKLGNAAPADDKLAPVGKQQVQ